MRRDWYISLERDVECFTEVKNGWKDYWIVEAMSERMRESLKIDVSN